MTTKLDRARRLLAVQRQRDRLSKWRLAELFAQSAWLDERHQTLTRFLYQEAASSGPYSLIMLRRLKTLEEMRAQAATGEEALRSAHLEDRRYLRHAERMAGALQSGYNQMLEAKDLEEAVGSFRSTAAARFPQANNVTISKIHKSHKDMQGVD